MHSGVDLDRHRHAVGDDVVDSRAGFGLFDDLAQLGGVVALELEADLDLLVPVADSVAEAEDAEQVDVALDSGLDLGEVDLASRRDVGDAGGEAGGQGVQHVLDRRRGVVGADEYDRMIGVEDMRVGVLHLLHRSVEAVNGRLVVGAADPFVGRPELELGDLVVALDGIEGGEKGVGIDTVAGRRVGGRGH